MTNHTTEQENFWAGEHGVLYLKRNKGGSESRYKKRKEFYDLFSPFKKDVSILEVGCNCGINLQALHNLGFTNLSGIDIGQVAIDEAKKRLPNASFTVGSLLNMPYGDSSFDIVFSSGVLIHQNPKDALPKAMAEMQRCSNQHIIGLEDYSSKVTARNYVVPGLSLYWKAPFLSIWQSLIPTLNIEEESTIEQRAGKKDSKITRQIYKFLI
jgi:pseudaminic acid biosynthesis-associated methylase